MDGDSESISSDSQTIKPGEETISSHAKNILEKMKQPNRAQAVLAAMEAGIDRNPVDLTQLGWSIFVNAIIKYLCSESSILACYVNRLSQRLKHHDIYSVGIWYFEHHFALPDF
jgi:hypothetical protein